MEQSRERILGQTSQPAEIVGSVVSDVRRLCKAVSEEEDAARAKILLEELLQILDERRLIASLF
jgi:hypothetical protein